jgi:plastocyanin
MRRTLLIVFLAVLALALVACGGGDADTGSTGGNGEGSVSLTIQGSDDFRYDPAAVTVPAGAEVTLTFENVGTLEHNWVLVSNDIAPEEATEADAINNADAGVIAGGESITFTFTAPEEPGTYQYVCTVPGHAAAGMVGTLTVE